jgi:hypothetical protein
MIVYERADIKMEKLICSNKEVFSNIYTRWKQFFFFCVILP